MVTCIRQRGKGATEGTRFSVDPAQRDPGGRNKKKDKRQRVPPYAPHPPCPIPPCQGARARGRCRHSQSRGRAKECSVLGW